jgi:hypothetical protein
MSTILEAFFLHSGRRRSSNFDSLIASISFPNVDGAAHTPVPLAQSLEEIVDEGVCFRFGLCCQIGSALLLLLSCALLLLGTGCLSFLCRLLPSICGSISCVRVFGTLGLSLPFTLSFSLSFLAYIVKSALDHETGRSEWSALSSYDRLSHLTGPKHLHCNLTYPFPCPSLHLCPFCHRQRQ